MFAVNLQLIPQGQTRFAGFDDQILNLDTRGMTGCEIQDHLAERFSAQLNRGDGGTPRIEPIGIGHGRARAIAVEEPTTAVP